MNNRLHASASPCASIALLALAILLASAASARDRLDLRLTEVSLPGPPAILVAADVDGDGTKDLVAVVAYIYWDQIGIEESYQVDEIEGVVEAMTIVPALFDRRELLVFLGDGRGGYSEALEPLTLDRTVLSIERGPEPLAVVALTDEGMSRLVITPPRGDTEPSDNGRSDNGQPDNGRPVAQLVPFLLQPSLLSGTGALLSSLDLLQDLDGDGADDLLLPTESRFLLFDSSTLIQAYEMAARANGPVRAPPDSFLQLPEEEQAGLVREIALPTVRDLDGDGRPELLVRENDASWKKVEVLRNLGRGRYQHPVAPLRDWPPKGKHKKAGKQAERQSVGDVIHLGDLDGDGIAEVVTQEDLSDDDAGMRKSMKQAKVPPMRHHIHAMDRELHVDPSPRYSFETIGYASPSDSEDDDDIRVPGGFQDLDGDGRQDLITVTLDFSLLQAIRILATRSISIGMDFHVYCQSDDGSFRSVSGLDLSGKFKLRLDDLRIGQLSQFAGDFDGDGRRDFVQMGRGKTVTLHRGRQGCSYAPTPDFTLSLREAPKNLALVRIEDFDGDGLSDLLVIQPQQAPEPGLTPPVRLDFYLSGEAGP